MKVKVISRDEGDFTKKRSNDIARVHRNLAPEEHPFERAREYKRASNAVKLDKVFAKPFIGALEGHMDGPSAVARNPKSLTTMVSGCHDGEIRIWHLPSRRTLTAFPGAHQMAVSGVCMSADAEHFLSCGIDATVKIWKYETEELSDIAVGVDGAQDHRAQESALLFSASSDTMRNVTVPVSTYTSAHALTGIDHQHGTRGVFATSGSKLDVWDVRRSEPVHSFEWGVDTVTNVRFNPVETHIFASGANDNSLMLYDLRAGTPIRKLVLANKTNAVSWNPMEAFNFTSANEDGRCYTYDMRRLDQALNVHADHVGPVMDVDYSPTGKEFVTGSFDRTVRIFERDSGRSRAVYHTKRMQRVFQVKFTQDSRFVVSGSDDTNLRVWKSNASANLRPLLHREKVKRDYDEKLKERFKHAPDIKRIARHQHVPKKILNASRLEREMDNSRRRKEENRRKHDPKAASAPKRGFRKKNIVAQQK